jgi:hypothetical protein
MIKNELDLDVINNVSHGNYQGYKIEYPLSGFWFIFEKEGKTVVVYFDSGDTEKIIS